MLHRLLILTLLVASGARAEAPVPKDFAFGMPVMATEVATAYRVSLPLEVYRNSARPDLGDVRVFNAGGEAVAYAISRRTQPATPPLSAALPLFPLRGDARAALDGLKLTLNTAQTSVQPNTAAADARAGTVEQYVLDGRSMDTPLAFLTLAWPDKSPDFSGRLRIEASDDFAEWRTVVRSAPVANLHALGQELIENRIDLPSLLAKFWRLTWLGAKPPFEITGARATAQSGPPRTDWSTEFVDGVADSGKGEFLFDLGASLPVERLNLVLPNTNTLYMIELSSRGRPQDAWTPVTRTGVYRLTTADGEQHNSPAAVRLTRDRYWRARILGNGAGPAALRLEATWSPPDVEFLAQGTPPFLLAFGNATVRAAESDLAMMPSSATVARATLGARRPLGAPSRLGSGPADGKRSILWVALLAAVGILAVIARRLARPSRPRAP